MGLLSSVPFGVSRWLASSTLSIGYEKQKEIRTTHHHVVPRVLRSLASLPSFLHLLNLLKFAFYLMPKVLVIRSRIDGEKHVYFIFLGAEVLSVFSQLGFPSTIFYEHMAPLNKPEGHQTTCRKHLPLGFM